MTAIASTSLTLADLARRQDAKGNIDDIVEILSEENEVLEDMVWMQCNNKTSHKTTIRSGLPAGTWRMLNYGVQPEKSRTVQVTDGTGMLETYSKVDKSLVEMAKDKAAFRMSEDRAFISGMNQTMATTLFYGDASADPEKFTGLAPRYNSLSAENASNIISAGGSSALTSIWLVCWDDLTCHGIYPEGTMAGLQANDLGEDTLTDGSGNEYQGYRTHYKWDCGLTLRDWRYVVRIANIATGSLTKNAATGADLIDLMAQAIELLPVQKRGKCAFYCNRTIRSFLRRQINNKSNVWLNQSEVGGKRVLAFDDIPVRRVDAITNAETQVS